MENFKSIAKHVYGHADIIKSSTDAKLGDGRMVSEDDVCQGDPNPTWAVKASNTQISSIERKSCTLLCNITMTCLFKNIS